MIWKKNGPSLSQFCLPMDSLLTVDAQVLALSSHFARNQWCLHTSKVRPITEYSPINDTT